MQEGLLVFVRPPELGKVKTRLAATVGEQRALAIYERLLDHTRSVCRQAAAGKYIFYAGEVPLQDPWISIANQRLPQANGDLGARMEAAFETAFTSGCQKVVIIGSDCPLLEAGHLEEALSTLNDKDVVIGPSTDGGYYLLGMKRLHTALFRNRSWSTSTVFAEAMETIEALGLSVHVLEALTDVDEEKDLPPNWREG
jgi:rSAM/selenodomain-associated transferase 1